MLNETSAMADFLDTFFLPSPAPRTLVGADTKPRHILRPNLIGIAIYCVLAIVAASNVSAAGVPAIQVTAPNGSVSILLGTLHVPYPGLMQPAESIMKGRTRLVIEGSTHHGVQPEPRRFDELFPPEALVAIVTGQPMPRAPWASDLSHKEIALLVDSATCLPGITDPAKEVEGRLALRSAFMASSLSFIRCKPGRSRDTMIMDAAAHYGVQIDALEDQVFVEELRHSIPESINRKQFRMGLQNTFVLKSYTQMVQALNSGDYPRALNAWKIGFADPDDADIYADLMVTRRNYVWMDALQRYLLDGNAVILVGAAHLPGPDGLLRLLSERGYTISHIDLPASE